jgi:hypothetical protein
MNSITAFVKEHYTIGFKGDMVNPDDLTDVNEFILIDDNKFDHFPHVHSLFINTFAKETDAILLPSFPSMEEVSPDRVSYARFFETKAKILGWDIDTLEKMTGFSTIQKYNDLSIIFELAYRKKDQAEFSSSLKEMVPLHESLNPMTWKLFLRLKEIQPGRMLSSQASMDKARETFTTTFLFPGSYPRDPNKSFSFLKDRKAVVLIAKFNKPEQKYEDERRLKMQKTLGLI